MNIRSLLGERNLKGRRGAARSGMLKCRRCESEALLALACLGSDDHVVYRCRDCGFLFSPPDGEGRAPGVLESRMPQDGGESGRRLERVAAVYPRRRRDGSEG